MKNRIRFLVIFLVLLISGLVRDVDGAAKEGEWVRVPSKWLLHRFVRPSTAPARTYRVALAVPPGANKAKVVQSSGNSDVDELAGDFALVSIQNSGTLKLWPNQRSSTFSSSSLRRCSISKCEARRANVLRRPARSSTRRSLTPFTRPPIKTKRPRGAASWS